MSRQVVACMVDGKFISCQGKDYVRADALPVNAGETKVYYKNRNVPYCYMCGERIGITSFRFCPHCGRRFTSWKERECSSTRP